MEHIKCRTTHDKQEYTSKKFVARLNQQYQNHEEDKKHDTKLCYYYQHIYYVYIIS